MRIESVSPSSEMLRACVEKCPSFSVFYKGGVIVSVDRLADRNWELTRYCWELTRYKNEKEVSSFKFIFVEGSEICIEGSDFLVTSMMQSMWDGYQPAPGLLKREKKTFINFIETAMRVYGGKIADVKFVSVDESADHPSNGL